MLARLRRRFGGSRNPQVLLLLGLAVAGGLALTVVNIGIAQLWPTRVVVTASDVSAGKVLTNDDLDREWKLRRNATGAAHELEEAVGRRARDDLEAGAIVQPSGLAPALMATSGRVLTLPIDESVTLTEDFIAGDRVALWFLAARPGRAGEIVENVEVIARRDSPEALVVQLSSDTDAELVRDFAGWAELIVMPNRTTATS